MRPASEPFVPLSQRSRLTQVLFVTRRIAVDGEPGLKEGVTMGDKMRTWSDGPNPVLRLRDGVFGLADGDGVIRELRTSCARVAALRD